MTLFYVASSKTIRRLLVSGFSRPARFKDRATRASPRRGRGAIEIDLPAGVAGRYEAAEGVYLLPAGVVNRAMATDYVVPALGLGPVVAEAMARFAS